MWRFSFGWRDPIQDIGRNSELTRLANVSILGKEREPGVDKLDWYGNFDTGFSIFDIGFEKKGYYVQNPVCGSA